MSVVLITHHNESIYDTTKVDPKYLKKKVTFKSKHATRLREFYKKCVKLHATMGVPEEVPPDPEKFLKKRTGKPAYIDRCRLPPKEAKAPSPVPKDDKNKIPTVKELQQQEKKPRVSKNFILHNIKLASHMKPKEIVPKVVIDRSGTKKPLAGGLEPTFIRSSEFGKMPHYLIRFVKAKDKKRFLEKDTSANEHPKCRYITKEERDQLLSGLKQNWEELQKQYQGLPILTDTIPKRNRKCKIESDLKQIEKDIVLVERHPYIYVYDDNVIS